MTTDADLTTVEGRIQAAITSIKTEIDGLVASLSAAANGDGMTATEAATHVTTLQGLATTLEALETESTTAAAPPAPPPSGGN